ncbi:hypothetical protein BT69DRAFT_1339597 [Atractiella rhizophila]|nr:hypothetical protein BT69DRAFT_1339597 [Atractiella rhizophila]
MTNSPHPPKHKVNVTEYTLPTLLHGHDLQVFVVSWRGLLGRGPIQRSMFVVGAEKEKDDWAEDVELDGTKEPHKPGKPKKPKKPKHGKKKAHAAPIIFGDAVARAGAIQTLPRVLIPKFHQHVTRKTTSRLTTVLKH